ncbi:hypothetical protein HU773_018925 [Pseudomonas shahriarae]|uniref:hypothetical protein n=1 Tax=Pseudomonas shahriarae TaxID=2745512 RepID=UPI0016445C1F|nr:hypothetical protein [Pseudomonas shahriarae]QXH87728.1 hypothetical protein HU773_018925 [Pseudomonas shahriarae]
MSSIENIRFYAKQVTTFEEGFAYAKSHRNYHLLSLDSRHIFFESANVGVDYMAEWRKSSLIH